MNALEARRQIADFLEREIVGPDPTPPLVQTNGEEILTGEPPHLRYGGGVLFPQAAVEDMVDSDVAQAEDMTAGTDVTVDVEGAEEGRDGKAEMTVVDEAVSLANAFLPSALGFSCVVDLPEAGLDVLVTAAVYQKRAVNALTKDGREYPQQQHLRQPFAQTVHVPSAIIDGPAVVRQPFPVSGDGVPEGLEVQVLSRPCGVAGRRLLTVTLVNRRKSPGGRAKSDLCFFQVGLDLRAADASACVLEYPVSRRVPDQEEQSLALLYRHRKTYGIGHGCAAHWEESAPGRATAVRSDLLPRYELKPIVPTIFNDLSLRMLDLADVAKAPALLDQLCEKYERWIEEREAEVKAADFPDGHLEAADRHLRACRECLKRMEKGVVLLRDDKDVRKAFALANRAMLLQQVHYSLPLREWQMDAQGTLNITPVALPDSENPPEGKGTWYPFQLAFILINLQSLADPTHTERALVDLIWFPTGGGKTEAYLGLSAFEIVLRRLRAQTEEREDASTAILMRYTLRLLTAQQFERAAALICALEYLRREEQAVIPGGTITIGLWAGGDLSPNMRAEALEALRKMADGTLRGNPFVVLKCPWCGASMGQVQNGNRTRVVGYSEHKEGRSPRTVVFRCQEKVCAFGGQHTLPLLVIDEDIYDNPPTLVVGTVDKFALLPWKPEARGLFGLSGGGQRPPDLIIQDELHLISGPLGSMVGHYETVIQELCRRHDGERTIGPKIVASTATISRAAEQCHSLYDCGANNVFLFPPQALKAGDSFFAREDTDRPGRMYLGVHASALKSHVTAQVRVMSALLQAPLSLEVESEAERDPFWTLIGYFNSLRELGHAATLIQADIKEHLNAVWQRKGIRKPESEGGRDRRRFVNIFEELTSRIPSDRIPRKLQRLFAGYPATQESRPVDACFATNMIGVGVDVPRLSLMVVVGQPKTTSEYIQATSRVGRKYPGLVVTVYNTGKPRDRSHYEHFHSYHSSIYRQVEPTSVTPFATPVRERALHALMTTLVRYLGPVANRDRPQPVPDGKLQEQIERIIRQRVGNIDPDELDGTMELVRDRMAHWDGVRPDRYGGFGPPDSTVPLMYPAGSEPLPGWQAKAWATPSSMRAVDADCEALVLGQYPRPVSTASRGDVDADRSSTEGSN